MKLFFRIAFLIAGFVVAGVSNAETYVVERSSFSVGFDFSVVGQSGRGTMPLTSATIEFDPDNLDEFEIDAVLAANEASAGVAPFTAIMKSAELLETDRFPEIRFQSTQASGTPDNLQVSGQLTIRDVTLPVTFQVSVTPIDGAQSFAVRMNSDIDRQDFGLDGCGEALADRIGINIAARINVGNS